MDKTDDFSGYCYSTLFDDGGSFDNITLYLHSTDRSGLLTYPLTVTITARVNVSNPYLTVDSSTSYLLPSLVRATAIEVRQGGSATPRETAPASESGKNEPDAPVNDPPSMGVKIGLAVGIVLGVLLIVIPALLLCRRKRKRKQRELLHPDIPEMHDTQRFEKDGKSVDFVPPIVHELDSAQKDTELPQGARELLPPTATVPAAWEDLPEQPSKEFRELAGYNTTTLPALVNAGSSSNQGVRAQLEEAEQGLTPMPTTNTKPTGQSPSPEIPLASPASPEPQQVQEPDPAHNNRLEQLQKELQRVRVERERLQLLQQLESRESELERLIQQEMTRKT